MVSRLQRRLESHEVKGIDMSPLLDVVFILLIFFIVSTVFVKETGVEVDKPQAISAQKLDQMAIMLAITQTNDVMYDNANIGVNGVRSTVEQLLMKEPRPVVIQVDKAVRSEVLVEVIDEAKLAGAATVNIATRKP
ncbi:biopolymer transporter ExbD [Alteromonas sp. KUL42]|uniref:ExbD/TolR family protein n=1 Tax=Alteromonas sp. KUL42 TaxID=2480797 RepID=UPI00079C566B|nr:biopolymer transporter ExbD [Alteromonas sp. KUL42]KXJ59351.1 MAG: biopolymer transporter ExbD [Alteromonas sp. Nap_26]TAP30973.1 biopolymer transporter ExbD [Alteromonas sp. KUL42]GEA09490.1 biopolymer transporter ExbD [Alteromonas sp. KUL42]